MKPMTNIAPITSARPVQAALQLLGSGPGDGQDVDHLRAALDDGERALFDRALELRRGFDDLNDRVLRSAIFAEASLGTAAFIHELRQCLAPLVGLSELVRESPTSEYVGEWASEISAQARRVADLLDRHAALLRPHSRQEEPCDPALLLHEAARYFSRLPPGVKLELRLPSGVPRVRARRRQLLHALINVIANARDAQRGRPGIIAVTAAQRGDRLEIVISDQGCGLDPDAREHLFEPLYTTKRDEGTGLGLYLSRELLKPDGELALVEDGALPEGAHTAFAIRVPVEDTGRAAGPGAARSGPVMAVEEADPYTRAKTRIRERTAQLVLEEPNNPVLIVEDEPAVRRMTRAVLESVAHIKIYEAADAAFAFKLLEKLKVDFLVCDKNLPDQDGLEVIRQARQLHPSVDAMIVTGYPSPESAAEAIRVGATDYLLKPIREVKTLRESVTRALRRQRLLRLSTRHERVFTLAAQELRLEAGGRLEALAVVDGFLAACDRPPEPHRPLVAVLAAEAPSLLDTGVELVVFSGAEDLARVGAYADLVVFPAESAPGPARELLEAARRLPSPPALCAIGQFEQTETAVVAIEGRTSVVLDRAWSPAAKEARLREAASRQRREGRAEALGRLLLEVGFQL